MDIGTPEIVLIVLAVILVFGVGKLGNVGGALGKSVREFRKEKDRIDDTPQFKMREATNVEVSQIEVNFEDQNKG